MIALTPSNCLTVGGIVVLGPTAHFTAYFPSPSPLNELALDEAIYGKCLKIRKPFINVHYYCQNKYVQFYTVEEDVYFRQMVERVYFRHTFKI